MWQIDGGKEFAP